MLVDIGMALVYTHRRFLVDKSKPFLLLFSMNKTGIFYLVMKVNFPELFDTFFMQNLMNSLISFMKMFISDYILSRVYYVLFRLYCLMGIKCITRRYYIEGVRQ